MLALLYTTSLFVRLTSFRSHLFQAHPCACHVAVSCKFSILLCLLSGIFVFMYFFIYYGYTHLYVLLLFILVLYCLSYVLIISICCYYLFIHLFIFINVKLLITPLYLPSYFAMQVAAHTRTQTQNWLIPYATFSPPPPPRSSVSFSSLFLLFVLLVSLFSRVMLPFRLRGLLPFTNIFFYVPSFIAFSRYFLSSLPFLLLPPFSPKRLLISLFHSSFMSLRLFNFKLVPNSLEKYIALFIFLSCGMPYNGIWLQCVLIKKRLRMLPCKYTAFTWTLSLC